MVLISTTNAKHVHYTLQSAERQGNSTKHEKTNSDKKRGKTKARIDIPVEKPTLTRGKGGGERENLIQG